VTCLSVRVNSTYSAAMTSCDFGAIYKCSNYLHTYIHTYIHTCFLTYWSRYFFKSHLWRGENDCDFYQYWRHKSTRVYKTSCIANEFAHPPPTQRLWRHWSHSHAHEQWGWLWFTALTTTATLPTTRAARSTRDSRITRALKTLTSFLSSSIRKFKKKQINKIC